MSIQLGNSGSIPTGIGTSISIPTDNAPQNELRKDQKLQMLSTPSGTNVDTYKLMASSSDTTPGYLDAKIYSQFGIVSQQLRLINFGALTTDSLTEGATNLYLTSTNFNNLFALRTTTNLTEGTNKYFTTSLFNSTLATKTTDNLTEGVTNLYFTSGRAVTALVGHTGDSSIHFSDLSGFTTDDLAATGTNAYVTAALIAEIGLNTTNRHTHTNKSLLDGIINSGVDIADSVTKKHTHSNKATLDLISEPFTTALKAIYDGYGSSMISSVTSPLNLTLGVLSHVSTDGNKHVPTNSGVTQHWVLASGASQGSYVWESIDTVVASSGIFETSPSTSVVKGLTSNYIKTHVENSLTAKHVTAADLTYIGTTIPAHIASTLLHTPAFTPTTDRGKFLYINNSDAMAWTTSATNIIISGTPYISAVADTITAVPIRFTHTSITAGDNITIDTGTDVISATQRAIESTPTNGNSTICISSDWAYDHSVLYGTGGHIPTGGTSTQYVAGDGTIKDFSSSSGGVFKVTMGSGATGSVTDRLASGDTVFPSGWSGTVGTVTTDLNITHTAARAVVDITIFADDGTDITKLIGSAGYSTIIGNQANTIVRIVSLATVLQKIHIYIQFE